MPSRLARWAGLVGAISLVLSLGCSPRAATSGGSEGAPCQSVVDCGPGLGCDLASHTCRAPGDGGAAADGGVDAGDAGDVSDAGAGSDIPDARVPPDAALPPRDGAVADCLFFPPPAAFAPQRECRWNTSTESPTSDDVVMTPVVGNLTDDNWDGRIDTDDIPDIAFLTYDRNAGCCNQASVLRVVSGRCDPNTGQLPEHVAISTPAMDNSAGIAIGDIDGDLIPDIVTMRQGTNGTVAFTSVLYDHYFPTGDSASDNFWVGTSGSRYGDVDEDPFDTNTYITANTANIRQGFAWTYNSPTVAAIATVRVQAVVRGDGTPTALSLYLKSGGVFADSVPVTVTATQFEPVRFEWRRNPFNGSRQWQEADLAGLEFGVFRAPGLGGRLNVTQVRLIVGYVQEKWRTSDPGPDDLLAGGQPSIADLDRDGIAEVIIGRVVLDGATGATKWRGLAGRALNGFMGPVGTVADIDLDGVLNVIAGTTNYRADGWEEWTLPSSEIRAGSCSNNPLGCDGFNAVGNFDADPEGEVVIVLSDWLYVVEHDGQLKVRIPIPSGGCGANEGGPPTVADFDGDGRAEIAAAGSDYYVVFDLDCCLDFPDCLQTPPGALDCDPTLPGVRWAVANNDCSSRVTGSSVFDFDGDGISEVIYNDETDFRIFSGPDGTELYSQPNISHTRLEYPIVADVDNDGNAEIVFIENNSNATSPDHGIEVWGDSNDAWVPTRRIWNQHGYYVTNITEGGLLPPGGQQPNWLVFNNFRQNLPDFNVFAAPDIAVRITGYGKALCPATLQVEARVCNEGDLRVGAGIPVSFWNTVTNSEVLCAPAVVTQNTINPGACESVVCNWPDAPAPPDTADVKACADNLGLSCIGPGQNNECDESNNTDTFSAEGCGGGPG